MARKSHSRAKYLPWAYAPINRPRVVLSMGGVMVKDVQIEVAKLLAVPWYKAGEETSI